MAYLIKSQRVASDAWLTRDKYIDAPTGSHGLSDLVKEAMRINLNSVGVRKSYPCVRNSYAQNCVGVCRGSTYKSPVITSNVRGADQSNSLGSECGSGL